MLLGHAIPFWSAAYRVPARRTGRDCTSPVSQPRSNLTLESVYGVREVVEMDVRSIEAKAPVVEHNGTVPVWWMIESREFKDITDGGYLELVNEFEVPGGGLVDPHSHPTHEFYYVMNGKGVMTIDGEDRDISQGDLVYIPPDKVHSLRPISDHAPIHCFCFAIGVKGAGKINYTTH